MKVNSTLAVFGFLGGLGFGILSAIRYFVVYPDLDRALVYVLVGMLICAVSWVHNRNIGQENRLIAIEDYISDRENEKDLNLD